MSYSEKFFEWQRKAKDKAKEITDKYNFSETVDQTVKIAEEAFKKGEQLAQNVSSTVDNVREKFNKFDTKHKVTDNVKWAAKEAAKVGVNVLRSGAGKATEKAEEATKAYNAAKETAKEYKEKAEQIYSFSTQVAEATNLATEAFYSFKNWLSENPVKVAAVSAAALAGFRLGVGFPGLDKIILGASNHWLFHSSLSSVLLSELSDSYIHYLEIQESLVTEGKFTDAEVDRIRFQKDVAKYVGAPLLGMFNIALGSTLIAEIFSPSQIVGFPISIVLGGNPLLESIWLFGNGVVCIYNGYKLIAFTLKDQADIQKVLHKIKALLPEPIASNV